MSRPLALLIAIAIGGASCSSGEEPLGSHAERIVGGAPDHSHEAVVALKRTGGAMCSGALVSPDRVLTAAHCVFGAAASELSVVVGDDVTTPTRTIDVVRATAYPTYRGESEGIPGGVDLAVVELAEPLSIAPLPIDTNMAGFDGANVTLVGYGASDGADNSGVGVRRSVTLAVSSVCTRLVTLGGADANACFGDSGGAVLLGDRLVAIVSGGKPGCFAPTALTRLDAHARWIAAAIEGDPSAPCASCVAPSPACDASVESLPTAPDAATATPQVSARGGGCAHAPSPPGSAWLLFLAAVASLARRDTSSRRHSA